MYYIGSKVMGQEKAGKFCVPAYLIFKDMSSLRSVLSFNENSNVNNNYIVHAKEGHTLHICLLV